MKPRSPTIATVYIYTADIKRLLGFLLILDETDYLPLYMYVYTYIFIQYVDRI